MHLSGECFCGEIKYQVNGELTDARSCHCSRCRKVFSAQASAYALVNPDDFKWLQGEHLLSSYVGEHGAGVRFCSQCGSTLCGLVGGEVHGITLGCLNDDPGIQLARHIFVDSRASWETIAEGVPQFAEHAPADAASSESIPKV